VTINNRYLRPANRFLGRILRFGSPGSYPLPLLNSFEERGKRLGKGELLTAAAAVMAAGAATVFVTVRVVENRMVFAPPRYPTGFSPQPRDVEELWLLTHDGVKINAYFLPNPASPQVLIWLHGNAENIGFCLAQQRAVAATGINILSVDYRGYGKSEGKPGETGVYQDADAAYEYLTNQRRFRPEDIFVFGHSLGGAVAVDLASRRKCGGLIVQSSFTSARAMAKQMFPVPLVEYAMKSRFDSKEKIRHVRAPILIVHGTKDEVVPYAMGRRLFAAAPEPKDFLRIEGARHDNVLAVGSEAYLARLKTFFLWNPVHQ
jgi:uncharacterized protein